MPINTLKILLFSQQMPLITIIHIPHSVFNEQVLYFSINIQYYFSLSSKATTAESLFINSIISQHPTLF